MSEKQTSGNPATLRDLVMSSSPLPRAANRFAAPAPPATAESCAGSHHSALTTGADLPGHDNHTLILTGRTETAVSNNKSPILGNGTAPHNQIAIPCKHVAVFVAALDRMAKNGWQAPVFGNYDTGASQALVHNPQGFVPTDMARNGPGNQRPATAGQQLLGQITNMSPNYRGDPGNINNYSAVFLPNRLNTAYWIEDLHHNVLPSEIFNAVVDCGRIYAVHINKERVNELGYAAAKLVFIDLEGATQFYHRYVRNQNLVVRGMGAFVVRNRVKVPEQYGLPRHCSRCVAITGPKTLVNMPFLATYFDPLFKYQIDCTVEYWHPNAAMTTLEIRFGSFRAQANMAYKVLTVEPIFVDHGVTVVYARDPCDRSTY